MPFSVSFLTEHADINRCSCLNLKYLAHFSPSVARLPRLCLLPKSIKGVQQA